MEMNRFSRLLVNLRSHGKRNIKILEELIGSVELREGGKTLELGCGGGMVSEHLSSRYALAVIGTDVDPRQVEIARNRYGGREHLEFREADAARLPFGEGEFDLVVSLNVLHHIKEWKTALQEVQRVLKRGGHYLLVDVVFSKWLAGTMRFFLKHHGIFTVTELDARLTELGFDFARMEPPVGWGALFRKLVLQKK